MLADNLSASANPHLPIWPRFLGIAGPTSQIFVDRGKNTCARLFLNAAILRASRTSCDFDVSPMGATPLPHFESSSWRKNTVVHALKTRYTATDEQDAVVDSEKKRNSRTRLRGARFCRLGLTRLPSAERKRFQFSGSTGHIPAPSSMIHSSTISCVRPRLSTTTQSIGMHTC